MRGVQDILETLIDMKCTFEVYAVVCWTPSLRWLNQKAPAVLADSGCVLSIVVLRQAH
jgi:hypothetical protein